MTATLRAVLWLLSAGIFGLATTTAGAHSLGASYLTIESSGSETGIAGPPPAISGQWEIFLDDVQTLVNLDADGDLEITVAEFEQARERIEQAVLPTLTVRRGGGRCVLDVHDQLVNQRLEGFYAVLMFRGACDSGGPLTLEYSLLFDADRSHRAVLTIHDDGREHAAVLTPDAPRWADPSRWRMLASFIRQGTHHIWIGYDHVAFLVLLLLPAALRLRGGTWEGAPSWRAVALRTLGIVTAFTIAHSITLSIAVLGIAVPPERPVEIAIAASVVLAGLANLVPRLAERAAWIAFGFGLIHGFGFANVLRELGLTSDTLAVSLAGFNVGVELGQLAIVAVLLPVLYRLRDAAFYQRRFVPAASIATALLALGWLLERA